MIECSTPAACEQIAAAQTQFIIDAIPATMLVAIIVALVFQQRATEVME